MPLFARHYLSIKLYLRRTLERSVHNPAKEPPLRNLSASSVGTCNIFIILNAGSRLTLTFAQTFVSLCG